MMEIKKAWEIFETSISNYHKLDDVDAKENNPFEKGGLDFLLYKKNWIDTVQWHLEDIIRDPNIKPDEALKIKRRIDASNQERTDLVEYVDSFYLNLFKSVKVKDDAKINTESPAWAIDRLSILSLKVYHMQEEVNRKEVDESHRKKCQSKLDILLEQKSDLFTSISQLLADIESGDKYMKVYKQMKMYNDDTLNPVLYTSDKKVRLNDL